MREKAGSIRNGQEALEYIRSYAWLGSRPGLDSTRALLAAIGNPEQHLKFIHIVGTNGKGSTASMVAAMLTSCCKTTGLYTSPYISRFEEQMCVNGEEISGEDLAEITRFVGERAENLAECPTEFELTLCIALEYFYRRNCDFVVLEAGLGGRMDATNVIPAPEVVAMTRIGLDHTGFLGDTVEAIAAEKGAVIKPGCQVVVYRQQPSVMSVVEKICAEQGAQLVVAGPEELELLAEGPDGQRLWYRGRELSLPLLGEHQRHNAAVALAVLDALKQRWGLQDEAIAAGLAGVRWPARFEVLGRQPWFVLDGGHNPQCAESVVRNLKDYFPGKKAIMLMGILKDKDYASICALAEPLAAGFVTLTPDSPRALPAHELAIHLTQYGKPVIQCENAAQAVQRACELAGPDGLVCAFGSLYMAGAIRDCFVLG